METIKSFIQKKEDSFRSDLSSQKEVAMKDIGREGSWGFLREAWLFLPASNLPKHKVFVLERLRKIRSPKKPSYQSKKNLGEIDYRIGYYIIGRIGKMKDRWTWGQFCPMIPGKDLKMLMRLAIQKKVIL